MQFPSDWHFAMRSHYHYFILTLQLTSNHLLFLFLFFYLIDPCLHQSGIFFGFYFILFFIISIRGFPLLFLPFCNEGKRVEELCRYASPRYPDKPPDKPTKGACYSNSTSQQDIIKVHQMSCCLKLCVITSRCIFNYDADEI